jgi:transposase InsO family protein
MDYHRHARLTIYRREELAKSVVEGRLGLCQAAAGYGLSRQSAAKWVRRYREAGLEGLQDRSSRPKRSPRSTPVELVQKIEALRRERWTGVRIAQATCVSRATVSRILVRLKLNKGKMLQPQLPILRYEHPALAIFCISTLRNWHASTSQATVSLAILRMKRGAGWEFLYVAVDDHSRIAYVAMMPDEKAASASRFLAQAVEYFLRHKIQPRRVMTDNGPCFVSDLFKATCRASLIRHIRTRIYTPRTNGKAERFIQTAIREWAYARLYQNSQQRNSHLEPRIHQYNWHRPHASLGQMPPISRSGLDVNNLLRHHSYSLRKTLVVEGDGYLAVASFSRPYLKEYRSGFTGCQKFMVLKGTAFRPYVTAAKLMRL